MTKIRSLPAFVAANFKLQKSDFGLLALTETGIWAGTLLVMRIVYQFVRDPDILLIGVPGIAGFAMAVMCSLIASVSRIWLEFVVGVQMGATRRRMIAASLALDLTLGGMMLALAAVLDRVWQALYAGFAAANGEMMGIVGMIPAWGWLVAWLLPAGAGMLGGALVLRYGRRAGWTLYFVFLAICWSPTVLESQLEKSAALRAAGAALFSVMPVLGPAVGVAALAAAVALLWRVAIPN